MYTWRRAKHIHEKEPRLLVREELHTDCYRKGLVEKKFSGRDSQGAWRQDERIDGDRQS
jgi:hypothetical protein